MTPQDLAQSFYAFARGDEAHRRALIEDMFEMLDARNSLKLMRLSVELTRLNDDGALSAFDALMGMLTCEPVPLRGFPTSGWRAYALSTIFERPAGAVLSLAANPRVIARSIAASTGIPVEDIRVVAGQVATQDAYLMPPADVFRFCRELKTAMEVESNLVGALARRQRLANRLAPVLALDAVNGWRAPEAHPVNDEALFMVLIRGDITPGENDSDAGRPALTFSARYEMDGGIAEPLEIHHTVLGFGTPWEVFRASLHTAQAFGLCRLMAQAAVDHRCDPAQLQVSLAFVDHPDGESMTARAAVIHPEKGLLTGVIEHDLAEPDQYAAAVRRMMGNLRFGALSVSDSAFGCGEVDKGGTFRFLVPGKGWQEAPETFVAFPPV
ncbi:MULTISPECIES: hypothetical protein [unclassified Variovorax]|uniref:hypothetical protein n=1 Tax=unclassified Variovorax TaxID=663243 RepID=UPI00076C8F60|nr:MULTISPECIES: hypothetical protein [unclassified Variovorax]KWT98475.1 hypothetical protein APY03_0610 [Variovorax sp. WDL1]PNG49850.1 hypothetical protein CHC06_05431 [Variovorax sp. B2]PNG50722.1 hypothetical protein CHC07_05336 [Variovorax sp. B4]VTU42326.1 hypothetical protein H6P1_00158 [Variovorax sp. PBL-H6]VTU44054.1 hypothetical protein SRS16P1_00744 [Variovorax sp. SRS16]